MILSYTVDKISHLVNEKLPNCNVKVTLAIPILRSEINNTEMFVQLSLRILILMITQNNLL